MSELNELAKRNGVDTSKPAGSRYSTHCDNDGPAKGDSELKGNGDFDYLYDNRTSQIIMYEGWEPEDANFCREWSGLEPWLEGLDTVATLAMAEIATLRARIAELEGERDEARAEVRRSFFAAWEGSEARDPCLDRPLYSGPEEAWHYFQATAGTALEPKP